MASASSVHELYLAELPMDLSSAFFTHGLLTWGVLFSGWVAFCLAIDVAAQLPIVARSKLQADSRTDDAKLRALARYTVARNWLLVLVMTVAFAPLLKAAFPEDPARTMSVVELAIFGLVWLVSNDFIFTVFHTAFHEYPWLYKIAHKEHHQWKAPFAWMSHAMSWIELSANGIAVMAFPLVHALVLGRPTPLWLVWAVQLVSEAIGCVEHSGYDALFPLVLLSPSWFPSWLLSTTKHHDDHHRYFSGNYGGYLHCWDVLMGTELGPNGRRARTKTA